MSTVMRSRLNHERLNFDVCYELLFQLEMIDANTEEVKQFIFDDLSWENVDRNVYRELPVISSSLVKDFRPGT